MASGLLPDMERSQSVSLGQSCGEIVPDGSHLGFSEHMRHGQSAIESIDGGSLFGYSL